MARNFFNENMDKITTYNLKTLLNESVIDGKSILLERNQYEILREIIQNDIDFLETIEQDCMNEFDIDPYHFDLSNILCYNLFVDHIKYSNILKFVYNKKIYFYYNNDFLKDIIREYILKVFPQQWFPN